MSDRRTAADVLVDTLVEWGVDTVLGLPGDGINGIVESLRTRQQRVRFVVARHEEAAAFMACAYAKWTGRLGVCLATTGPGGVHLLNGLYDAKFDRAPVLAITGLPYHDLQQTWTQQDIDHVRLFQDVAEHTTAISGTAQVALATTIACRTALARRGVTHASHSRATSRSSTWKTTRRLRNKAGTTAAFAAPHMSLIPTRLRGRPKSSRVVNESRFLPDEARRMSRAELRALADRLGAPIAKALLGKDVLPDDDPLVTGGVGYLGARPSQQMFAACWRSAADRRVQLSLRQTLYPDPAQVRSVQIDIDATRIGLRFPVDAGVVGDAAAALRELAERLTPKSDRSFLAQVQQWKAEWYRALDAGANQPGQPMKIPERVVRRSQRAARAGCAHRRRLRLQHGPDRTVCRQPAALRGLGTLASMGGGLPYAIAAALAYPARQVVAIVGDGGLSMSVAELATCVRYRLPRESDRSQQRLAGADQVGADALPRKSRIRLRT